MPPKKGKKKPNVWVSPHEDGWAVHREGGKKPSNVTRTKKEAEDIGREIALNNETELIIQKKDGTIQNRNSFGNDPHPPKDKKH